MECRGSEKRVVLLFPSRSGKVQRILSLKSETAGRKLQRNPVEDKGARVTFDVRSIRWLVDPSDASAPSRLSAGALRPRAVATASLWFHLGVPRRQPGGRFNGMPRHCKRVVLLLPSRSGK
eukprot:2397712-Pyramimonas_sp.AAC.1